MADLERSTERPAPTGSARVNVLDGNALAGRLTGVLGAEPTLVKLTCGHCGSVGLLAESVVEQDDGGAIVRCRHCTRTLLTLVERDGALQLCFASLTFAELPAARQEG